MSSTRKKVYYHNRTAAKGSSLYEVDSTGASKDLTPIHKSNE